DRAGAKGETVNVSAGGGGGGGAARSGAEQEAVLPPFWPLHCQYHGPRPVTAVAVPARHRPEVGAVVVATPFARPHTPLMAFCPAATAGSGKADKKTVM